jgi:hypothetical protein
MCSVGNQASTLRPNLLGSDDAITRQVGLKSSHAGEAFTDSSYFCHLPIIQKSYLCCVICSGQDPTQLVCHDCVWKAYAQ